MYDSFTSRQKRIIQVKSHITSYSKCVHIIKIHINKNVFTYRPCECSLRDLLTCRVALSHHNYFFLLYGICIPLWNFHWFLIIEMETHSEQQKQFRKFLVFELHNNLLISNASINLPQNRRAQNRYLAFLYD